MTGGAGGLGWVRGLVSGCVQLGLGGLGWVVCFPVSACFPSCGCGLQLVLSGVFQLSVGSCLSLARFLSVCGWWLVAFGPLGGAAFLRGLLCPGWFVALSGCLCLRVLLCWWGVGGLVGGLQRALAVCVLCAWAA